MSVTLNDRQLQAIGHVHGPMLVVAGAGTGKTTVLVERIARLVRDRHARPDEILALTFTDNAAAEMAARVQKELAGTDCSGLQATTFHAYCLGILARAGKAFRVLTKEDLWIYLRQRIQQLPLDYYIRAASPGQFLDALLDFFERCHDEEVDADAYRQYVEKLRTGKPPLPRVTASKRAAEMAPEEVLARCQEIARVFQAVEDMLARENLGTFGHMITRALTLLRNDAAILAKEQAGARFLLIDEFQDVNLAQIELARLLAGKERNIFAVGDPDQAIYRFRGASAAAFGEFARRFPDTRSLILVENQRSRSTILNCAYAVIRRNPAVHCVVDGAGQTFERERLRSGREERAAGKAETLPFVPVEVVVSQGDEQEASDVAQRIEEMQRALRKRGSKPSAPRFAILYRSHFNREAVVRELEARKLRHRVVGLNALDTGEVRDLLACLRVACDMSDSGAMFRVAAMPMFGVDAQRLRQALAALVEGEGDFITVLEKVPGGRDVIAAVEEVWAQARIQGMNTSAVLLSVLERFRFNRHSPPVFAFANFVCEWRKKPVAGNGELAGFLEYMQYFPEANGTVEIPAGEDGSDPDTIRLMTAHSAKGLEFDHVFVLRLNGGSFPVSFREKLFEFPQQLRRGLVPEGDDREIHREEERRLCYVALTRARESLTLCARAAKGKKPNAFVRELMEDPSARESWQEREPKPFTADLFAATVMPSPGVGSWLLMPRPPGAQDGPLSATAVERYETCPLQFKIERDWNIPGDVAAAMQYGNAVHTLLRDYYESLRAGRPKSEDEVVQCLVESLRATCFLDPVQRELYEKEGEKQLREFVRLRRLEPAPDVLGTESGFEMMVEGVRVRGRLDRVDRIAGERVSIVDYKTGRPRNQQHADESLQLSIYAIAAREKWKYIPERLVFYNLADNTEVVSRRDEADLREARARVVKAAKAIRDGLFEPRPGFHCQWCEFRELCPATETRLYRIQPQSAGVH